MKKIYSYLFLAIIVSGCKKDFLELAPQSQINAANFYKTAADYNTATIGAYANLQGFFNTFTEMICYRSDESNSAAPTSGAQDRYDIDKFQDKPANTLITNAWSMFYNGIERCNEITSRIGKADFSDSLKNQYLGEALFLRSLHYYYLVQFWGNVPLVLTPIGPSEALTIGRTSVSAIYTSLENDLKLAITNLPVTYPATNAGRATKGAARTLLAKVLLIQKKYQQALDEINQVVSLPYQLLSSVNAVFDVNNKLNQEIIFSIRYNKEIVNEGHGLWFSTTDTVSATGISKNLANAYPNNDQRKSLLRFTKQGNVFGLNKFYDIISTSTRNAGNDYILFRLADILLMQAEARNEIGYESNGVALQSLNRIRTRAGLTAFTATDLPNQESFRNAVFNERRLELALEGHRWFDLLRSGTAKTQISSNEGITIQDFQLLFPIPSSEIQKYNNTSLFGQNPGYN